MQILPMRFTPWKVGGLVAGIVAFLLILLLDSPLKNFGDSGARPAFAAAVTALMAIWWLTEAFPIHVTACVPLLLYPLFGVFGPGYLNNLRETALPYVDPYIFLFAGGMSIAAAMQQCNLHRRIALTIMRIIGTDPGRLLFGFLAATGFISMWISNTATATMMVPIGIAVISQLEAQSAVARLKDYGLAIMLSIAYGANVGGIGTKIGTAPNAQFAGFMERIGTEITFLQFMAVGLPFVVMFLPIIWLVLWRIGRSDAPRGDAGAGIVADETARLGEMRREEWLVLGIFLATATLWIAGKPLTQTLQEAFPGRGLTTAHIEGGIAMTAAFVLLAWRSGGRQLLELGSLRTIPWNTLLLLGASFAMAAGIQQSGLSQWMGMRLSAVGEFGSLTQVLVASSTTVGVSAIASNTATIGVMLNVLKDAVTPEMLPTVLFAATIAASCDFALPAGTPPNAIVFGSGYVTIPRMARTGVVLDAAAAIVAALWCWLIVRLLV